MSIQYRLLKMLWDRKIAACPDERPGWLLVDDGTGIGDMEQIEATYEAVWRRLGY